MDNIFKKIKNQKGYAILFAVVVISSISVIVAGLTNTTLKQIILSSLAKDSQIAFYQTDTASDCAFYAEMIYSPQNENFFQTEDNMWSCGGEDLIIKPLGENKGYELMPKNEESNEPCFRIAVEKKTNESNPESDTTKITVKGYNICNITNPKVVEREIEINY